MLFDSSGNLYVTNDVLNGGVSVFAPGATTPSATLTGTNYPLGIVANSSGDLFVANWGNGHGSTVSEFAPGSTTAMATLVGLNAPLYLMFDSTGNLYVANQNGASVSIFAPGSTTASRTLTGLSTPAALAFGPNGNLYVVNRASNTVSEFAPGSTTASITLTGLSTPHRLVFDSSGNLFVTNSSANTVSEFAPGSTTPTNTLTGLSNPNDINFDSSGDLFVVNFGASTVSEFAPPIFAPVDGGVVIESSVESRPMLIGGSNGSPVAGINLTSTELSQITTTATGTVAIGDAGQTGNITFANATPATTAGAALNVIQSTSGTGQVILDDGAGAATALNGNGGNLTITAGTGGIVAPATSNSTAEISTTGASVTLLTAGPIGSNSKRVQFADDSNTTQQIVSIGSTSVQPSSVYLDGLGSLTLGSILGNTTNSAIDVTARTNLTVAAGSTINSGASPLSLGADLTAAKAGDDGVGTLSINAGATVTSSNSSASAITLRGADVNIDTSTNPALIGTNKVTPTATYVAGLVRPVSMVTDSSGNLYILGADNNVISKFVPGSSTASRGL